MHGPNYYLPCHTDRGVNSNFVSQMRFSVMWSTLSVSTGTILLFRSHFSSTISHLVAYIGTHCKSTNTTGCGNNSRQCILRQGGILVCSTQLGGRQLSTPNASDWFQCMQGSMSKMLEHLSISHYPKNPSKATGAVV